MSEEAFHWTSRTQRGLVCATIEKQETETKEVTSGSKITLAAYAAVPFALSSALAPTFSHAGLLSNALTVEQQVTLLWAVGAVRLRFWTRA